jgi:hypothetical protein
VNFSNNIKSNFIKYFWMPLKGEFCHLKWQHDFRKNSTQGTQTVTSKLPLQWSSTRSRNPCMQIEDFCSSGSVVHPKQNRDFCLQDVHSVLCLLSNLNLIDTWWKYLSCVDGYQKSEKFNEHLFAQSVWK